MYPFDLHEELPFTDEMRPSWTGADAPVPTVLLPAREPAGTLPFSFNDILRWLPQASRSERIALASYLAKMAG